MARQKFTAGRRHTVPTRVQDGTGLEERIFNTFIAAFFAPFELRLSLLEAAVADLQTIARNVMQVAEVTLQAGRRGGTVYVEPEGGFEEDAIGQPVMVQQGQSEDDQDEGVIVLFTGEVINARQLRLRWHCAIGAPSKVQVVYLIG